ncbi:MBL fold metallo-hydrolase [Paludibacter sp. 221]|uniref:MBL fold metallo-hydrolase n=1 Tax=Paludibacter sp. 221 TaxID=2302939 RepID=UPI0013D393E2|nr:MBL fold metallo-hydrolase [Paludibacter sp. 221]NDV46800.1 MBL fold metallo-hydrolase [Paludibacter sp. 221]
MKLYKIEAGVFHCDGGAVFGVVPKRVWQKRYPADEDNFCALAMRCLLVDTGDKRILIDTGTGDKQLEYLKYYNFKDVINFETELDKIGYSCSDITDVVLTHLHFDHCGGCTYYADKESKRTALTFPNADYWVGERQWANFLNPNVREADSYFPENMLPVHEAGRLKLLSRNEWLTPEIELRLFDGHTVGQIVPYIYEGERVIVYVGDVIPMAASIPIAWISAYDTYPIASMQEKERLLEEAASEKQVLFFEHDTYTECCTVKNVNGKYRVGEVLKFEGES